MDEDFASDEEDGDGRRSEGPVPSPPGEPGSGASPPILSMTISSSPLRCSSLSITASFLSIRGLAPTLPVGTGSGGSPPFESGVWRVSVGRGLCASLARSARESRFFFLFGTSPRLTKRTATGGGWKVRFRQLRADPAAERHPPPPPDDVTILLFFDGVLNSFRR